MALPPRPRSHRRLRRNPLRRALSFMQHYGARPLLAVSCILRVHLFRPRSCATTPLLLGRLLCTLQSARKLGGCTRVIVRNLVSLLGAAMLKAVSGAQCSLLDASADFARHTALDALLALLRLALHMLPSFDVCTRARLSWPAGLPLAYPSPRRSPTHS